MLRLLLMLNGTVTVVMVVANYEVPGLPVLDSTYAKSGVRSCSRLIRLDLM